MLIEDPEFRELFQTDTLEHIQNIETGLINLEKDPKDADTLKNIFREAHSMKGAAGLLGLKDIEAITHILEDQLGKASKGVREYKPEESDRILFALDQLRILVDETITGKKSIVDLKLVIDVLNGTESIPNTQASQEKSLPLEQNIQKHSSASQSLPNTPKGEETHPNKSEQGEDLPPKASSVNIPSKGKIDTMRVDPTKLDLLLGYSGELTVSKNRIQKRSEEISEFLLLIEENAKYWTDAKKLFSELIRLSNSNGISATLIEEFKNLYAEEKRRWDLVSSQISNLKVKSIQDSAKLSLISQKLEEGIQNVRLLPLSSVFDIFPRTIRDIARELSKEVFLSLEGGHVTADKLIIEEMKDPLMHLIRNSLDHGIETREERIALGKSNPSKIRISGKMINQMVVVEIEDDGKGLDQKLIKERALNRGLFTKEELESFNENTINEIIFHAGFSTKAEVTSLSGRGVGMDVVKTFVEKFKGSIEIETLKGEGTKFTLRLPINFSTNHALIVQSEGWKFAIPTEFVEQSLFLEPKVIQMMEGNPVLNWQNKPVRMISWRDLFPSPRPKFLNEIPPVKEACMILNYNGERVALVVEKILDKQEILLKPFLGLVQSIPLLSGTTILESGDICYMIQVSDVFQKLKRGNSFQYQFAKEETKNNKKKVLLAEDSLITRARLQSILEEAGYEVVTAVDGEDAANKFSKTNFDLLMTDLEMPKKDGLQLVEEIRKNIQYKNFPILILTSLGSEEQIQRGKLAGANAYLVKSKFDNKVLLQTVERLLITD